MAHVAAHTIAYVIAHTMAHVAAHTMAHVAAHTMAHVAAHIMAHVAAHTMAHVAAHTSEVALPTLLPARNASEPEEEGERSGKVPSIQNKTADVFFRLSCNSFTII